MARRFWCEYEALEEYHAGMWRKVSDEKERDRWVEAAVAFLSDPDLMRSSMRSVLDRWPASCRAAFSNPSLNKPVWLAHAGACSAHGIPEEFMRIGYWKLPIPVRARADADAEEVATEWRL